MRRSKPTNSSRPKRQSLEELRVLQRRMAGAIMRPRAERRGAGVVARSLIKPNDRLSSLERLEIYHRQYWFRLLDCFYDDFPGLRAVLGDRRFSRLAAAYLDRHPSTSYTLRNLGRNLISFLDAGNWPRQALDMARLEWAHIEAFDNEAKSPLTADQLLDKNPARLRLHLQPHITLLSLRYPLDDYLIALREKDRFRGEASNAAEDTIRPRRSRALPLPKPAPIFLVVHRHRNVVHYKRLAADQFHVLSALAAGKSPAAALRVVADAAAPIQEWFQDWSVLGWFWIKPWSTRNSSGFAIS